MAGPRDPLEQVFSLAAHKSRREHSFFSSGSSYIPPKEAERHTSLPDVQNPKAGSPNREELPALGFLSLTVASSHCRLLTSVPNRCRVPTSRGRSLKHLGEGRMFVFSDSVA